MAYTYRPDLLPFALPKRVGLPYHGTPKSGRLALPNSTTIDYPQPDGGDVTLVVSPRAAAAVQSDIEKAHDDALGYQWLTHAFLSGSGDALGGRELSSGDNRCWLFCTASATWKIRLSWSSDGLTYHVYAVPFGILSSQYQTAAAETLIGTHTFVLKDIDDTPLPGVTAQIKGVTHSQDGAITIFNLFNSTFAKTFGYCGAVRVRVAMVGAAPVATVTTEASGSELYDLSSWENPLPIIATCSSISCIDTVDPNRPWINWTWSTAGTTQLNAWNCVEDDRQGEEWDNKWSFTPSLPLSCGPYGQSYTNTVRAPYFVLPNGAVNCITSTDVEGVSSTTITSVSGPGSGSAICATYFMCPAGSLIVEGEQTWVISATSTTAGESTGKNWQVAIGDANIINLNSRLIGGSTRSVTRTVECGAVSALVYSNDSACVTEYFSSVVEDDPSSPNGTPASGVYYEEHNNNIYDFYRKYTVGITEVQVYVCSATISGTKFNRAGKAAVWNPLTNTVVLADNAAQSISIV
jgi:hypothetical protein